MSATKMAHLQAQLAAARKALAKKDKEQNSAVLKVGGPNIVCPSNITAWPYCEHTVCKLDAALHPATPQSPASA
jgi:hypothetical protein